MTDETLAYLRSLRPWQLWDNLIALRKNELYQVAIKLQLPTRYDGGANKPKDVLAAAVHAALVLEQSAAV